MPHELSKDFPMHFAWNTPRTLVGALEYAHVLKGKYCVPPAIVRCKPTACHMNEACMHAYACNTLPRFEWISIANNLNVN